MEWQYTAGETILIIGGTLTSVGTLIVSIITALKTNVVQNEQQVVKGKVEQVHDLTNSRLSRIEGQLALSESKLATALILISDAEVTRVTLAQEKAKQDLVVKLVNPTLSQEVIANTPVAVEIVQDDPVEVSVIKDVKK